MKKHQRGENGYNYLLYNFPSLCVREHRTIVAPRVHWTEAYLTWALTVNQTSGQLHKAHTVRHCNITNPVPGLFVSFFFFVTEHLCQRWNYYPSDFTRLISLLWFSQEPPPMHQMDFFVAWKDFFLPSPFFNMTHLFLLACRTLPLFILQNILVKKAVRI